jgi:hypothetical protein
MATNSTDKPPTAKATHVARESHGRRQLVPYPGWLIIARRLAARRP